MVNICVVGIWHQASIVSTSLAEMGHNVICVGDDKKTVANLNSAEPPVAEPGLNELLDKNLKNHRLRFTTSYADAVKNADFVYIALDTPVDEKDVPDVSAVENAAVRATKTATGELVVIVGSQVPVGTCDRIAALIKRQNSKLKFQIAYVPEFLRLGSALDTFFKADRFVVGADEPSTAEKVADIFRPLGRPLLITSLRSAEMGKTASNAFLATSISLINEISDICEKSGADILQVARIMKLDQRIGERAFLTPGLGFAGGTLGRDLRAFQVLGNQFGKKTAIMDAVMDVNVNRVNLVPSQLKDIYGTLKGLKIGILGLTYKAGTSTLRRSVALESIYLLKGKGATITAFDPLARIDEIKGPVPFKMCKDPYEAAKNTDAVAFFTEWDGFNKLDLGRLKKAMKNPVFIDTRNAFGPDQMRKLGFSYIGVGRAYIKDNGRGKASR